MANYHNDRIFTDYVFNKLAKNIIYNKVNWKEKKIPRDVLNDIDIHKGIDAVIIDHLDHEAPIQYRFREEKYANYNDFTLRYKREENPHADRVYSEFFKIEAKYLLYGITNGNKNKLEQNTEFKKWAVIDLDALKEAIDNGLIIIDESLDSKVCIEEREKMICPVKNNTDGSSSFVLFDIKIIKRISTGIIVFSYGFDE
ncbi:hypothetical protein [Neisseria montereyensis]|uniref:Uncharacterized protein n=1 Tax=Neisseria montereyensis TaxID=2973938 RepID=A0ABT2FD59_9NEIS|nr:hypothetical protein [Neisseria montereyensis]MCS4534040.1 hypothetical protein [Neisseria montereyensis]